MRCEGGKDEEGKEEEGRRRAYALQTPQSVGHPESPHYSTQRVRQPPQKEKPKTQVLNSEPGAPN